jgi:hypothetical protein
VPPTVSECCSLALMVPVELVPALRMNRASPSMPDRSTPVVSLLELRVAGVRMLKAWSCSRLRC